MSDRPRAALDIGSNTIRLLVARVRDGRVEPLLDESEFVRLGAGVDASGELDPDRQTAAVDAIRRFAGRAREEGAEDVVAIATSAVRDARNGPELVRRVEEETGVHVEIISGEREAYLTYLGATLGISAYGGALVSDLGGGSAEIIYADEQGMRWAVSKPLGSGRLSERFVTADPPREQDLEGLAAYVTGVLKELYQAEVTRLILTGGTATHIGWLAGKQGDIQSLSMDDIARVLQIVSGRPSQAIIDEYGVKPERARVLPAGVAAVDAIAGYYRPREIFVTQHGIREGALLDSTVQGSTGS